MGETPDIASASLGIILGLLHEEEDEGSPWCTLPPPLLLLLSSCSVSSTLSPDDVLLFRALNSRSLCSAAAAASP